MIPQSGSINILAASGTLTTTTVGAFALTGTCFSGSTQIIVTTAPNVAFANLNSVSGIFLTSTAVSPFAACTRVIAQRSPISYAITAVNYASTTVTLTVNTLPVAPVAGQLIHIESSTNSALNGTYTLTGSPTITSLQFTLATNPGTGFTNGVVFPGINTSTLVGYYTINRPATANVTAGTLVAASQARNPFVITTGATHVIAQSGTASFANIFIDAVGSVTIPCNQLLAFKNLKGGACFMATGTTSGTDVLSVIYATYNPLGNS
jgi:hypothetical protein